MARFKLTREERRKGKLKLKGLPEKKVKKREREFKRLKREKEREEKKEVPEEGLRKRSIWFWIILLLIIAAYIYFRYIRE